MSEQQAQAEAAAVLSPPSGRGRQWTIRRGLLADQFDPAKLAHMKRIAKEFRIDLSYLQEQVAAEIAKREAAEAAPAPPAHVPRPVAVKSWDKGGPASEWPDLETALRESQHELLGWGGDDPEVAMQDLASLDFDVDKGDAGLSFTEAEVSALVTNSAAPLPFVGWRSKSGGVRLIFRAEEGQTARARASLFVLLTDLARDDRVIRVEILHYSRRPPPGARVIFATGTSGVRDLRGRVLALGGETACSPEEIEAWLSERGLGYGRNPHTLCPISPGESGRDPVIVGEEGVICHRCQQTTGRGWLPWAALIGKVEGGEQDPLAQLAAKWVHWTHAHYVLRASLPNVPEKILRAGFEAMLVLIHGPDDQDRIRAVFDPSLSFVRGETGWLRADDWKPHDSITEQSLRLLPWVHKSGARVDLARGSARLPGYVPLVPIPHLLTQPEWSYPYVLVPRPVPTRPADPLDPAPYSWEEIQAEVAYVMQGATTAWLDLVLALVVGALRAQRAGAMPPMTIVYGPSGSGKGAAVAMAEGILGSPRAGINLSARDANEVALSIGMGLESGAMILFGDELGKTSNFWSKSAPLLSLCDTHSWRKLHAGQVTSTVRAHVVLACSTLPRGLTTMPEFDRRVSVFRLPSVSREVARKWETRVQAEWEVASLSRLRLSARGSRFAEGFIHYARRFVPTTGMLPPWSEQAATFGSRRLAEDEDAYAMDQVARDLYALWLRNDPATHALDSDRLKGWLRCYPIHADPDHAGDAAARIASTWLFDDDSKEERFAKLGRLETVDCRAVLGVAADVRLLTNGRGRKWWVRFDLNGERAQPPAFPALDSDRIGGRA